MTELIVSSNELSYASLTTHSMRLSVAGDRYGDRIGLIISSDRAFSEPVAVARGSPSISASVKYKLGAIGSVCGRNRPASTVVKSKSRLAFLSVNSL